MANEYRCVGIRNRYWRVELPFIFKGGTSLLLLLDKPMRLSTDIDIIVEPGTEVDVYLERAAKIFPFKAYEEQIRKGKNDIEKRHFKFKFESPRTKEPVEIILDVCVKSMVNENFTEEQARSYLKEMLPKLDYWKRYDDLVIMGSLKSLKSN